MAKDDHGVAVICALRIPIVFEILMPDIGCFETNGETKELLNGLSAEPGLNPHLAQEQRERRECQLRRGSQVRFICVGQRLGRPVRYGPGAHLRPVAQPHAAYRNGDRLVGRVGQVTVVR